MPFGSVIRYSSLDGCKEDVPFRKFAGQDVLWPLPISSMMCLISPSISPVFNLAAEEYMLAVGREDCFMLWQSSCAVIVGRNQNAWAEINAPYVLEKGITVIRRISGGGAVYHDGGNVNFSFIRSDAGKFRAAYGELLNPVLAYVQKLGVPAYHEGCSDLSIGARKISGNAQAVQSGKLLHHGTLLFDSDLSALSEALRVTPGRYTDKAVSSIRRPVTNIRPYLDRDIDVSAFMEGLLEEIQHRFFARRIAFSEGDRTAIHELAAGRYDTWEWNFGHSPAYRFQNTINMTGYDLSVAFDVRCGRLRHVQVKGRGRTDPFTSAIEAALKGCRHDPRAFREVLLPIFYMRTSHEISLNTLLDALF